MTALVKTRSTEPAWVLALPLLDDLQAGSLRHIFNRASQLPDDWSGMLGRTTLQEDFSGLRFQLAYMSYALALTHAHRLPAAPGLFREPFDTLIEKILSPDVWLYWHYVSTGNGPMNRSLGELPAQWNPVEVDNIMYSAYAQEGSLTFSINSLFWAEGGKHFPYNENSLNDHLYWNMVERGYLGIACEPNCVFQICNQVPILGFRLHDLIYGGNTAEEVTEGYLKAWSEFGLVNDRGNFTMMVQERERVAITPPVAPWADFWLGALMHAWNPDFVKRHYPQQIRQWQENGPDGTLWIRPPVPLSNSQITHPTARDFGWAAVCASEVGDTDTLERLLRYADTYLHPVWNDDGYHYRRHDEWLNADGNLTAMDPHTANALLPYARLNVPGGLAKLYAGVWGDAHFAEPAIVEITPSCDLRRAVYDRDHDALVVTIVGPAGSNVRMAVANALGRGHPQLARSGTPHPFDVDEAAGLVRIDVDLDGETTLVMTWR